MIISNAHKFVFIRNKKTGSTTCQDVLRPLLRAGDQADQGLILQRNGVTYEVSKVVLEDPSFREMHLSVKAGSRPASPLDNFKVYDPEEGTHVGAKSLKAIMGEKKWDTYFSFCFERNPWDKTLSWFLHRYARKNVYKDTHESPDITEQFNRWVVRNSLPDNDELYLSHISEIIDSKHYYDSDKKELIVNHVGKYENLEEELLELVPKLRADHIPYRNLKVPHLNKRVYREGHPLKEDADLKPKQRYRKWYNEESIELVRDLFSTEIELFNYKF